jgi:hypothetical protein
MTKVIHIRDEQVSNPFSSLCSLRPIPLVIPRFDIKSYLTTRYATGGTYVDICKKCSDKLLDYWANRITSGQRKELESLWFIFGNGGSKHTNFNHGFIQGFLEFGENRKKQYLNAPKNEIEARGIDFEKMRLTGECINEVEQVFLNF